VPFRDQREFIDVLRAHGELIEVDRYVDLYCDVGRALRKSNARGGPAILFRNNGTNVPLVAGIFSTRRKALLAFEATEETIFDKVLHGLDNPIAPVIGTAPAPCQEVVLLGEDVDIRKFPIPTYSPDDGGPFITPGINVSKDPETGVPDIGHYRYQIFDKNKIGINSQPFHRFGKHMTKCRQLGVKPQGAIFFGGDPIFGYACQVQVSDDTNDWYTAGGLRGAPVELVKCKTVDLEVPAWAEVIVEFEVELDGVVAEGPLGEYTGYYTATADKPYAVITAITHRRDPVFQGLLTGKPVTENHILKQIPFEASVYRTLKVQFPTLRKVSIPPSGGVSFYTVLAIEQRFAGEARQAILAAMSSNTRPKWVIAVDPDIDVYDKTDVEWAMSFRVQPARDVFIVDNVAAGPSDPTVTAQKNRALRLNSTVGIDATKPFGQPFSKVADVPNWQNFDFPELDA
jgi:2,5-furandicarboxylate decarboxylase 1